MATFWGDILRLLAHSGLQTGGNIATQLIGSYVKPGMEVRETAGKNLLDVLATQTGAPAEAAAETLKEKFGVEWPRATGTGPGGSSEVLGPGGVRLTAPGTTPIPELAPGYEAQKSLVRGVPSLDKLKAGLFQTLSPEEQKIAAFPKETAMDVAKTNLLATLAQRAQEGELNRASRESLARESQDLKRLMIEQQHERLLADVDYKKQNLGLRKQIAESIGGAKKSAEEQRYATQLTKALDDFSLYQDDPRKAIVHAQNFNNIYSVAAKKFPETIGQEYSPYTIKPEVERQLWFNTPPKITPGVKDIGGRVSKKEETVTTIPLTFPRRVRVSGKETIVNSQEEYDALRRGLSK